MKLLMNTNWKRYEKIKGEHEDWAKYTGDKTFYDLLNIDMEYDDYAELKAAIAISNRC